jgi:hypothetical protein
VGCIAGAIDVDTYKSLLIGVGLTGERTLAAILLGIALRSSDIVFVDTLGDLNVYCKSDEKECCSADPPSKATCNTASCNPASSTAQGSSSDFDANIWVGESNVCHQLL